jgi:alcohol dehydrogenase
VKAGHVERGMAALQRAGVDTVLYDGVAENPTTEHVEAGLQLAQRHEPKVIVGLGGGSAMDCAKGINFLHTNGGRMQDYWGVGKALKPMLPMIAVPTTAGTGSETQSFALISDAQTHVKMACGDKKASFRIAILDPILTVSQPERVTALTGIDAISHALETYVTTVRNPASLAFSREAWLLLSENFIRVLDDSTDIEARSGMQLGACFAGLAIENSMLGAAHALANPLTTHYGIPHGQAIALILPHVIRYNGEEFGSWYRDLLENTGGSNGLELRRRESDMLADMVTSFAEKAQLATRLVEVGVGREELPMLAADAAKQWTGKFNPRPVEEPQLLKLYEQAF